MRFGFNLFSIDPAEFRDIAIACDQSGWDHLALGEAPFMPEHVSVPYPHAPDGKRFWSLEVPVLDPWVAIAHMATVTQRLRFMPGVLRMAIRKPLLEAKSACSVAAISDDRLAIGVGLGWMPEEYLFTNEDQRTRGARTSEAIRILQLCMTGEFVEFHGAHYDFDRLIMRPAPKRKIPIYVGGHAEGALRRAAQLCDGWMGLSHGFEEARTYIERLAVLRAEYGRADAPFDIILNCPEAHGPDDFRRLEDMGVTHCWVVPWHSPVAMAPGGSGEEDIDITVMFDQQPPLARKIDAIHKFGDEVIARL